MIIPRNNGYICRQPIDLAVFFMIAIRYDFELSRQMTLKKPVPSPHLWWYMSGIWKIAHERNQLRKPVFLFYLARNLPHWEASYSAGSLRWTFLNNYWQGTFCSAVGVQGLGVRIEKQGWIWYLVCKYDTLLPADSSATLHVQREAGERHQRHLGDRSPTVPPPLWVQGLRARSPKTRSNGWHPIVFNTRICIVLSSSSLR